MHAKQMGITILLLFTGIIVIGFFTISCRKTQGKVPSRSQVRHPEWSKNAVIYEVNIRQYSREGTFNAFSKDIPRLRNLGVDILWLMPVHPIGETDRKGSLGSYYSVKDYKSINKEFGTLDDF